MGHKTLKDLDSDSIRSLVTSAQNGERSAFTQIINLTQLELTKFLFGLSRNQQIAQDLCQDSYIKALQSINKLNEPEKLRSWLYTISRNTFYDFKRKKSHLLLDDDSMLEEKHDSPTSVSQSDTNLSVRTVLSQLSGDDQALLILIDMNGHSYAEAAEILNVSEPAVRSRLHRARKQFFLIFDKKNETNA